MSSFGFDLNEYIRTHRMSREHPFDMLYVEHIVCRDGYTLSVQASEHHYCRPKRDDADHYERVEVGILIGEPDELLDAPPGSGDWVFGYVPVATVEAIIWKHGGFAHALVIGEPLPPPPTL